MFFCVTIRRDLGSLIRFPFHSHMQVQCCQCIGWNFNTFVFLSISDFLILLFFYRFLFCQCSYWMLWFDFLTVFNANLIFVYWYVYVILNVGDTASSFFLGTYSLSVSSLGCKTLCICYIIKVKIFFLYLSFFVNHILLSSLVTLWTTLCLWIQMHNQMGTFTPKRKGYDNHHLS